MKKKYEDVVLDIASMESDETTKILHAATMEIRSLLISQLRQYKNEIDQDLMIKNIDNIEDMHPIIGSNIRKIRKSHGMTQHQLAKTLKITFQQLQKYENGKNKVSAARLYQLSLQLNVPLQYFFFTPKN
ncbi:MAG: helix-turn-helix domain-containing protein [Holosporaceae bacterium]|jgi:DNA-binding transcriptional regulator YiaG|nr:helix-turn-helix domain-containing protein [Holosporaceae bacterium]